MNSNWTISHTVNTTVIFGSLRKSKEIKDLIVENIQESKNILLSEDDSEKKHK